MPETPVPHRGDAFADLIKRHMHEHGLSVQALTEASGVARSTLFRWLSGVAVNPRPDQIRAVCDVLGINHQSALAALGYLQPEHAEAA